MTEQPAYLRKKDIFYIILACAVNQLNLQENVRTEQGKVVEQQKKPPAGGEL